MGLKPIWAEPFVLIGIASVALGCLAYVFIGPLPGVSPDSVGYLDAASSIASGAGLVAHDPFCPPYDVAPARPCVFTAWPPLYPALIAIAVWLADASQLEGARIVNAVGFGVLAVPVLLLAAQSHGAWSGFAAWVLLATFFPLYFVASYVWSELWFTALTMFALLGIDRAMAQDRGDRCIGWVLAGSVAGLAYLTRYAGLMMLGFGVLVALIVGGRTWATRVRSALAFGAGFLCVSAWHMLKNLRVTGRVQGYNVVAHSDISIAQALDEWSSTLIRDWLVQPAKALPVPRLNLGLRSSIPGIDALVLYVVGLVLVVIVIRGLRHDRRTIDRLVHARPSPRMLMLMSWVVAYWGFYIVSRTVLSISEIDTRFLIPTYPIALVMIVALSRLVLDVVGSHRRQLYRYGARFAILVLGLSMVLGHGRFTRSFGDNVVASGQQLSSTEWRSKPAIRFLRDRVAADDLVLSDRADALAFHMPASVQILWARESFIPTLVQVLAESPAMPSSIWYVGFNLEEGTATIPLNEIGLECVAVNRFEDGSFVERLTHQADHLVELPGWARTSRRVAPAWTNKPNRVLLMEDVAAQVQEENARAQEGQQ